MDKITIKDLEVKTRIGVTAEERATPQRLLVSVVLERDLAEAGRNDLVSATADYSEVATLIHELLAARPRQLIEAVADEVAEVILSRGFADTVTVEVKKFSIPGSRYVAVEIHRTRP